MTQSIVKSFQLNRTKRQLLALFGLWIVFLLIYVAFKQHKETVVYAGFLAFIGQVGLDILITVMVFLLRKRLIGRERIIFALFGVSFLLAAITDISYNTVVNILGITHYSGAIASLFDIPFIGFHVVQSLAWLIIFRKSKPLRETKNSLILHLPVALIVLTILTIFLLANLNWKVEVFSLIGLFRLLQAVFQVVGFTFALLCLAVAINKQIRFITTGYLIITSCSFFAQLSHLTQNLLPGSFIETIWVLGLLLITFGFYGMLRDSSDLKTNEWLNSLNSVQAQCAFWSFLLCMLLIVAFCGITYLLIGRDVIKIFPLQYLPSLLIVFSVFAILISSVLARILSAPFERVKTVIDSYMHEKEIDMAQGKYGSNIYEFELLEDFLAKSFEVLKEKNQAQRELFECATQVAHDIRSPLAALSMTSNNLAELPESKRIIVRNATQRINDIANNLLAKYKETSTEMHMKTELVWSLLDHLVSEKRFQMTEKSIELVLEPNNNTYNCFVNLEPGRFKRIISNLVNNASEAIELKGIIRIVLEKETTPDNFLRTTNPPSPRMGYGEAGPPSLNICGEAGHQLSTTNHQLSTNLLTIKIIDNGEGIPEDILQKIKQEITVSTKKEGHGLGVYSAVQSIKKWNGTYDILSKEGEGTTFIIKLPIAKIPDWFQNELDIVPGMNIVVLDDDRSIHDIWTARFQEYKISLKHFYNPSDLIAYCLATPTCPAEAKSEGGSHAKVGENLPFANTLFLIDYELLGHKETGLDLIEKLNLKDRAILVTSRYEESAVKSKIIELGIKTIPKNFAPYITIKLNS